MASSDSKSLEGLFRAHSTEIRRYAKKLVISEADAEDITQEAFLRVGRLSNGRASAVLTRQYLYTTIHNLAIDLFRRNKLAESAADADWVESQSDPQTSISAERDCLAKENLQLLLEAIEFLPDRRQQVFVLARIEGHSHDEIARMLGTSVHTIRKQVVQAITECQAYISARGNNQTEDLSDYRRRKRP